MGRLGILALKGLGALLLAFVALSIVVTVVGLVLWLVGAAISALVTLVILALFVLAGIGLYTVMRGSSGTPQERYRNERGGSEQPADESDPKAALQEQYVEGELTDAEFERELERVLSGDEDATGHSHPEPAARSLEDLDGQRERDRDR
ncbi:hypothetical protein [Natrarchaeobaculum aegyptiacum]|uniref:SHOCT domain-containing protein n=1 Tax=Natrarchaeobaculum aegyptiacum TaxID=745377 RepID=A0A2Z2HY09_9EURY|nr:hypothetical protein [Natrarchaeobaculum aegyptiacum]ARS90607.1 hypothetical protein B1756_13310 [Natrarchaeobaculum aegyptiacum]